MTRALWIAALVAATPRPAAASCSQYPELCGLDVTSTIEQADLDRAVDVVLVGDGFTDVATWHTKANSAISTFKSQSATTIYAAVPNVYNFHIVDVLSATTNVGNTDLTDTALGMHTAATCGAITCIRAHNTKVNTAALNAPDVDITIAIANSGSGRANAYYASQLASGGSMRLAGLSPISHEMGHAAIGLADEYVESALCDNPTPAQLVRRRNITADGSCLKFSTTPGAGCVQGGDYCSSGVWRSASGCIMRSSGNTAACPVCARTIETILLEKRTGVDVAEPWAVVTTPADGATVSGEIDLRASLFDDWFAPVHVSFVIDGAFVGTVTTDASSAVLPFDTRGLADGTHTIGVFADDSAGHAMPGLEHSFNSVNGLPTDTLAVSITYPADGAAVSGMAFVSAAITGDGTAVVALLYIDGVVVDAKSGTRLTSTSFSWDATAVSAGNHTLVVGARDSGDTEYSSAPISVTVEHPEPCSGGRDGTGGGGPIGNEGGCVYIQRPAAWEGIGTVLDLQYTISELSLPTSAELVVDGAPAVALPQASTSNQRVFVDASGWTNGPHVIEVVVDDGTTVATGGPVPVMKLAPQSDPLAFIHPEAEVGAYACGQVDLLLNAEDDVGVVELVLLDNGVPVATAATVPGTVTWDATTASPGVHSLMARAGDGDGNFGYSAAVSLRPDCTPPTVVITEPDDGAMVAPDVQMVVVDAADEGSSVARRELYVDGVLTDTTTGNDLFVLLDAGSHTLMVRVIDQAGNSTDSATITVTAADCASTGCDDGITCTTDVCSPVGRCLHELTAGCCSGDPDCDDGDGCTTDTCNTGTCENLAVAGCCNYGWMCDDGDATTQDLCSGTAGACSNPPHVRCDAAGDCDDGLGCTTDGCILAPAGYCSHDWAPACCDTDPDCDDGNPCTTATCDTGACVVTDVPGCCVVATDCDDGDFCTTDLCFESTCRNTPKSNCCADDGDCVTYDPCATVSCHPTVFICQTSPTQGCCTYDFECTDWDPCTADTCDGGACSFVDAGICCAVPADCDDANPCTTDDCDTDGFCQRTQIPGCCVDVGDCDDAEICTTDTCESNACVNTQVPSCCHDHGECDDTDVCTSDTCETNTCVFSAIGSCCHDANECDDGLACTTNTCEMDICVTAPIPNCCVDEADCDDGDPCTAQSCDAGSCTIAAIPGCCVDAADCNDGNICTVNSCPSGTCVDTPVPNCCLGAGDCDDSDPCTVDTCESWVCVHAGACPDGGTPSDGAATDGGPTGDASAPGDPTGDGVTSAGDAKSGVDGPVLVQGGCACSQSGDRSPVGLLLVALLALRRRHR